MRGHVVSFLNGQVVFAVLAVFFLALGAALKRLPNRQMIAESRINLVFYVVDGVFIAPGIAWFTRAAAEILPSATWSPALAAWPLATGLAVLLMGDLIGYWRHRIQHSAPLWPSHAVHHSDEALSWLTAVSRFHPIDRFGSACDAIILIALGFPGWSVLLNVWIRHIYGAFEHANLPWTYRSLGKVFISPAAHRWHHSRAIHDKNFAVLFTFWDRLFGTYYCPGPCEAPLGVDADMGRGALGRYLYPLRAVARRRAPAFATPSMRQGMD
jgi:sterol desaturase/sphingolipid hydroxylase (fatty acid hydroxylase superfamily)